MNLLLQQNNGKMNAPLIFPPPPPNQEEMTLPFKTGLCDDPWQIKNKYSKTKGKLWFILIEKDEFPDFKLNDWGVYLGIYNLPKKLKKCDGKDGRPKLNYIYIFQKDRYTFQGYPEPFIIDFG